MIYSFLQPFIHEIYIKKLWYTKPYYKIFPPQANYSFAANFLPWWNFVEILIELCPRCGRLGFLLELVLMYLIYGKYHWDENIFQHCWYACKYVYIYKYIYIHVGRSAAPFHWSWSESGAPNCRSAIAFCHTSTPAPSWKEVNSLNKSISTKIDLNILKQTWTTMFRR